MFLLRTRGLTVQHQGILDTQTAGDRGTEPLIGAYTSHAFATPGPLNVNDSDFTFTSKGELHDHDGITDCTMARITLSADDAVTKLLFNVMPEGSTDNPFVYDWETRKQFAISWRSNMHEKYFKHCDPTKKLHQILLQIIEIISLDLMLGAIRPLHKPPKASSPRVSGDYILELASSALERAAILLNMPTFREFLWFGRQYNQWHTIAVMLAELCIHTQGPAVDRAWAILDSSLEFYKTIIADSEKGMLWRPIEKLLRRAREKRSEALRERGGVASQLNSTNTTRTTFPPLDPVPAQDGCKYEPPRPAHEAMGFTPYIGPAPDGTSLGLSPAEIEATRQAHDWHLPPDFMKMGMTPDGFDNLTDSPDNAWQSWGSFTEGLQQQDESLSPMQVEQSSHPDGRAFSRTVPFSWMGYPPTQSGTAQNP
ncbi:MAG: hypothetical protein Q9162_007349 [Coniocarpon cinnabarinum]